MKPITILVPTLERSETLRYTLETCISQPDQNLKILVSDNYSQDNTRQVVESFIERDKRVAYINPDERLGMPEHWEFALDHINDGYVIVIGDDDGMLPNAIPRMRNILNKHPWLQAINWSYCVYYYKDLPDWHGLYRLPAGNLGIALKPGMEFRKSKQWLKIVTDCQARYSELAGIYHSLMDVGLLKELKRKTGNHIASVSPDVYIALALAPYLDKYLHLNQPLSVFGMSKKSNGFSQTTVGEHTREIPKLHLSTSNIKFHHKVPYIPLLSIFTIEAILQAQDAGCSGNYYINWQRHIELTHHELSSMQFEDEAEKQMRFDALEQICKNFGYQKLFEKLERNPGTYDWTDWKGISYDAEVDLNQFEISNIYDVSLYVQTMIDAINSYNEKMLQERRIRLLNAIVPEKFRSNWRDKVYGVGIDLAHAAYKVFFHSYHAYLRLKNIASKPETISASNRTPNDQSAETERERETVKPAR